MASPQVLLKWFARVIVPALAAVEFSAARSQSLAPTSAKVKSTKCLLPMAQSATQAQG